MENDTTAIIRQEILAALCESIKSFTAKSVLDPTHRQDANLSSRVNWVLGNGQMALRDLTVFFAGKNVGFYSAELIPRYVWFSCIFDDATIVNNEVSQIESLEHFWLAKDNIQWDSRPGNIFCMLAKSESILPQQLEGSKGVRKLLHQELPSSEAICQSAFVALLFLLGNHLPLGISDLYYLMAESLSHMESHHRPQLLCRLSTVDLCLSTQSDAPCFSVTSTSVLPYAFSKSSTKVLTFPGELPQYQTSYNYMDIYQPRGSQPVAKSSCAIWGAWKSQQTSWGCVGMPTKRQKNICRIAFAVVLSLGWSTALHLQSWHHDGRLILRNAAEDIEEIKYRNSAKPSIASANVCLMYLNHFHYFKRMTESLCEDGMSYPPQWQCPAAQKAAPPEWFQEVGLYLGTLNKEVVLITREVEEIRKMILEQHNLLQSRKTGVLTILVSIFVPISFVATFFGMNTREMNDSHWKLKYYFITAIPLAVLTVFLPLIILPTINFVSHHLAAHRALRGFIHWGWILTTLVLNIYLDISKLLQSGPVPNLSFSIVTFILLMWAIAITFLYLIDFGIRLKNTYRSSHERRGFMGRKSWWILFYVFAILSFAFSFVFRPFIELPAYLIYFFLMWYRRRKQKSRGKEL